ncbi:hypothetical protein GCM10020221_21790 [Streptomyces thioluteus]|uniref:Uncharacterized protein n=1 Tax=Streptomyces thioluteus TaxID=66431 RepID=A0ABN3WSQ2_STRTU
MLPLALCREPLGGYATTRPPPADTGMLRLHSRGHLPGRAAELAVAELENPGSVVRPVAPAYRRVALGAAPGTGYGRTDAGRARGDGRDSWAQASSSVAPGNGRWRGP